eukprot:CAMPEP_0178408456 /NCGR_PEP_ID=MMETSP0689_2-20121128/19952_1 /TAXON_ID=160604 /ORGANISM="Amphidinium massartii, Strain CS-259" /LENGTH=231 /DNA_ID=CAMNT_0020029559 /DNA_START=56 /DNA_END=748 /DNA_ORIENTATION=+
MPEKGLPVASREKLLVALLSYGYLFLAALSHCLGKVIYGTWPATPRLCADLLIMAAEYAWEVWLSMRSNGSACCVLLYGEKTWSRNDVLQHHAATLVAFAAGMLYVLVARSLRLITLYSHVFVAILLTCGNELLFVIPALGGESWCCRMMGLPAGTFPIETARLWIAVLIILHLVIAEAGAMYLSWSAYRHEGDIAAAIYGPFFAAAFLGYHLPLLRANIRAALRVCRTGW